MVLGLHNQSISVCIRCTSKVLYCSMLRNLSVFVLLGLCIAIKAQVNTEDEDERTEQELESLTNKIPMIDMSRFIPTPTEFVTIRGLLEPVFNFLDKDKDGLITKAEFKRQQRKILREEHVDKVRFQMCDSSNDSMLSLDEMASCAAVMYGFTIANIKQSPGNPGMLIRPEMEAAANIIIKVFRKQTKGGKEPIQVSMRANRDKYLDEIGGESKGLFGKIELAKFDAKLTNDAMNYADSKK